MFDKRDLQLILLPPLGADSRIFYAQRELAQKFTLITPDPLHFNKSETLREHAARIYDDLLTRTSFDPACPVVWGGASLGGALAQELALLHKPEALVLIGTFRRSKEIALPVRAIGKRAPAIPLLLYKTSEIFVPLVMRMLSYLATTDIALCAQMYRDYDKDSFRNGFRALSVWNGVRVDVPVLRIHGEQDPIIPAANIQNVDQLLKTMHLVSLAKPQEVNNAIRSFLRS